MNHVPSYSQNSYCRVVPTSSINQMLWRTPTTQCTVVRKLTWTVLALLLVALLGCGGGSTSHPSAQQAPPIVLSSVPPTGATGVPLNECVAVTFNQAMDPATLTPTTFTISGVGGTVAYDSTNKTAVFCPSTTLAGNTTYVVNLTTGIKSATGVPLAQSYSFTFVTGSLADTTPPTILATSPANGATNVSLNTVLTVTFSEAMDPTGLVGQTSSGISASLTYDSSTHTGTLTPSAKLAPNTQYTATVQGTVKDLAGNPMGADYVWTFTTGAQ